MNKRVRLGSPEDKRLEKESAAIESKFPLFELKGGPHGHKVDLRLGGEPLAGVTRVELIADVSDAIRLITTQIVSVNIEARVVEHQTLYDCTINVPRVADGQRFWESWKAQGPSIRDAFEFAADLMEKDQQ